MNRKSWIFGLIALAIPIAIWLLLPMEPTTAGVQIVGKVQMHIAARGNKASPKPYYRVALKDGLVVNVQDYGQVSAKNGDSLILQERFGVVTGRRTFAIVGISNGG